ncbi:ADP-heptose--LPS heptosyltransferase II [Candidatus Magnetoovum chiemensis]|nr:ADP-heptose--LPS heptosyltransferase II [Candidatus Magnetoovum chiemensis]
MAVETSAVAADDNKILIRAVNWIGDAVMTMPAVRVLKDHYDEKNGSALYMLANSRVLDLFKYDPNLSGFIEYMQRHRSIFGKWDLIKRLKAQDYSGAVLFQNAFDAAFITAFAGIKQRIGYDRDGRRFLLTKSVPVTKEILNSHQTAYYLNLLEQTGIAAKPRLPWIYLTLEERLAARHTLNSLGRPIIGVSAGADYGEAKIWHHDRFAEVIRMLITQKAASVVLFGSSNETKRSSKIAALLEASAPNEHLLDLTGKTTVRQLCALISECDALLTNDSGPMHIAYAAGTPVCAVFGSTSPELTAPQQINGYTEHGFTYAVCKINAHCSPCFKRTCKYGTYKCMNDITVEQVFDSVAELTCEKKAVFFDRDGTLCRDAHYLNRFEDFKVFPEIDALRALKDKGYMLIGISNQSGIGRGIVDEEFVRQVNRVFIEKYGFDDFLYCPHRPDERCACRKPSPGMLYLSRSRHRIDLKRSIVVGDKDSDMLTALAVGALPIFIKSAKHSLTVGAGDIAQINNLSELLPLIT